MLYNFSKVLFSKRYTPHPLKNYFKQSCSIVRTLLCHYYSGTKYCLLKRKKNLKSYFSLVFLPDYQVFG
uniref:Uncharacterized protein n=1 Tax=Octopus bimaculoides TaxID=37653 RepID=A0A0L8GLQ8_OCTBM